MVLQVFANGKQSQRVIIGEGSGFFISADGYIVTNNRVAARAIGADHDRCRCDSQDVVPDIFDTC